MQGWVVGAEGFSATDTILILVAWALTLVWMVWLLVVAWQMRQLDPPAEPGKVRPSNSRPRADVEGLVQRARVALAARWRAGELRDRRALLGALGLVLNAVVMWNTRYIDPAVNLLRGRTTRSATRTPLAYAAGVCAQHAGRLRNGPHRRTGELRGQVYWPGGGGVLGGLELV